MTSQAPPRTAYPWFLASSSLWMAGMSLQGFLFTWLLVGSLEVPADEVGFARSLAEFPPLAVLLLGGILGDRTNARSYLMTMHLLMSVPPLLVAMIFGLGLLGYWWVVAFGVLMAGIQSLSDPARQATLSRVARMDVQRAVTVMTVCTSLVGLAGLYLGGQMENLGLVTVLLIQSFLFLAGLGAAGRLPSLPVSVAVQRPGLASGFKAIMRIALIRDVIALNLLSSLFNAGAYVIAIPYIVKEVYLGGAETLATAMIVFTTGAIGSNLVLLYFMPLKHPGRIYLGMQLTRLAILVLIWMQPAPWLFPRRPGRLGRAHGDRHHPGAHHGPGAGSASGTRPDTVHITAQLHGIRTGERHSARPGHRALRPPDRPGAGHGHFGCALRTGHIAVPACGTTRHRPRPAPSTNLRPEPALAWRAGVERGWRRVGSLKGIRQSMQSARSRQASRGFPYRFPPPEHTGPIRRSFFFAMRFGRPSFSKYSRNTGSRKSSLTLLS